MLVIATDEAGYGPKLGPLVVAASTWKWNPGDTVVSGENLAAAFEPLRRPIAIGKRTVRIDDSKAIFKPGAGLDSLHAVVSASHHWCGHQFTSLDSAMAHVAFEDAGDIAGSRWLSQVSSELLTSKPEVAPAIEQWSSAGIEMIDVRARVVTAHRFNQHCDSGQNKADLLSQSTLKLVRDAIESNRCKLGPGELIQVFCDRHGGRRYYAGVIQHLFPDGVTSVSSESKTESVYQCRLGQYTMRIAFTVKGDRFAPVAMSSLHAKYWRERFMESFNAYFASHYRGKEPLARTAGYPVDADRFLGQVAAVVAEQKIGAADLIRQR